MHIRNDTIHRLLQRLTLDSAVLALAACASAPPLSPSSARITAPQRLDVPAANEASEGNLDRWWTLWKDPYLDALVDRALASNADVRVAEAHVRAARALVSVAESALYPSIAASGAAWVNAGDTDIDGALGSVLQPYTSGKTGTGYLIGLGAQWEPDIFGGRHADVDTAHALAESTASLADGVRLVVIGDVVENYQQWAGLQRRLALLGESIAVARRLTDYASARQRTGQATAMEVAKAQGALASLEASRPPIMSLIDARQRRLAVLAGDLPEQLPKMPTGVQIAVPPPPSGQFPSTILGRRPDVRARMLIVEARAARLKSLQADLMPRFGISFMGQNGQIGLSGLPGFGGSLGLVSVKASVPIFTGGLLRGRIAAGNAELAAALAAQDRAMLNALEEVETAYGFRAGLDQRLSGLDHARDLSENRAELAASFYKAGRVPLGDVLQARLDALSDLDRMEQARIAQGTATVQLYRAVAGGWGAGASPIAMSGADSSQQHDSSGSSPQ